MNTEETSLRNDINILVSQLRQLVEYYTHSSTLKVLEGNILSFPKTILLLVQLVSWWRFLLHMKIPKLKESLIVNLLHAYMAKIQGKEHVRYTENALNFYQVLQLMGIKYFGFCSGKLLDRNLVLCSIYMQKIFLIQYNFEMLVKYLEGIVLLMKLVRNIPSFSVSIDAPKVSKTLSLSTAHRAIIGVVHTNHVISIEGLDQVEVKNILAGEKVEKVYELKTALLYSHKCPVGTCPYVIISGRP